MALVTLPEAKAQLNIAADDTRADDELKTYLGALTQVVEDTMRQVVEQRDFSDVLELTEARRFCLGRVPVADLGSVSRIDVATSYNLGGFLLVGGSTGLVLVTGGGSLTGVFQVDYTAGPDVVPDNVKRGALVILQHTWELQRGVGTLNASGDWAPQLGFTVPNRAREWLGPPMPLLP